MKRWKSLTAALCAVVLLCGFSVPAYAYADGGEGADYGDSTMTEETPAPEPTIEPGEGFSEEGNLVTCDLLYDEHTNKQFITVQTSGGNTFYIVIDYDKPVDEEGEQYETYFLNVVDEADLLAAAEAAGVEQAVCSWRCWPWPWWAAERRFISRCCAPNNSRLASRRMTTARRTMRTMARPGTRTRKTARRTRSEFHK